jgi:hypothetical protein
MYHPKKTVEHMLLVGIGNTDALVDNINLQFAHDFEGYAPQKLFPIEITYF